jgi:Peptidase family M1 domain
VRLRGPASGFVCCFLLSIYARPVACQTAAELTQSIRQLSIDPQETYRVRDVRLRKGDVNIYLNEGVLSFTTPIGGRIVGAVFTTRGIDAGDAEILLLPPQAAERASLASFTKSPNLDEHFSTAVFFFSDETRQQILEQITDLPLHRDSARAQELAPTLNPSLQATGVRITTRILQSLLRNPNPGKGYFFSVILGRERGAFDFLYDPNAFEPVVTASMPGNSDRYVKLWTSYRPRSLPPYQPPPPVISAYKIEADVKPDLSLSATAKFDWEAGPHDGRAITFSLSRRLDVDSAEVNGEPAEIVQEYVPDFVGADSDSDLLVVPRQPVVAGQLYKLTVRYHGFVIRKVSDNSYFVSERNVWYPHLTPMLTTFDLTFHCPAKFQLVSTGELVSDDVNGEIRTVHRSTQTPQQLAGFNLGEYRAQAVDFGKYHIECYADRSVSENMNNIPQQCQSVVQAYTNQWLQLPIHTLAVTPIAGYFGQGFPGLIYLSSTAYMPEKTRPQEVRNPRADTFFEDILLPHEIAHQWWGNLVSAASYRSDWLMESMANYSALQLLEEKKGRAALDAELELYRRDLKTKLGDDTIESAGPVDFGTRLLAAQDERVWQVIVYEKGTWILHMLRERLGEQRFRQMQVNILKRYHGKPITNEEFREVASAFVLPGEPDPQLNAFFETWIYGTGIPALRLSRNAVEVSGVDDGFTVDVPLNCTARTGGEQVRWVRLAEGANPITGNATGCHLPRQTDFLYTAQ